MDTPSPPEPRPLVVAPDRIDLAILLFGALLRVLLWKTYRPEWSYDFDAHLRYLHYVADRHALPPLHYVYTAYHPPLYFWIGALLLRAHVGLKGLQAIGILGGILQLAVLWWMLRRWLPSGWVLARAAALLLAAVLPCAVHLDGMIGNEALHTPLAWIALALAAEMFAAEGRARGWLGLACGAALALAWLSKVSTILLVIPVAGGAAVEIFRRDFRRALAPALAVSIAVIAAVPVHARFYRETHRLFSTAYDGPQRAHVARVRDIPYLDRRSLGYVFGTGDLSFFRAPQWPADTLPHARFWPVLVATTFGDYYNYAFAGEPRPGEPAPIVNVQPMNMRSMPFLRASVAAGVPIALATVAGLGALLLAAWRRRSLALGVLVAAPLLATLGQLHFAIKYPIDQDGPVKGHYLQFAMGPLFAAFGLAVEWLWRRPRLRALAAVELLALVAVAAYTIYARLP